MATTAQEIERLVVRLTGDGKLYESTLKKAELQTKAFARRTEQHLKSVGQQMRQLGRTLSLTVTAPLAVMGGVAVRSFAKFDQAMTESLAIMDTTAAQAERMSKTAIGLSFTGKALQGPAKLAEGYYFLASANKSAEQSMKLLPAVSKFATAGMFELERATEMLVGAQSTLGLASENAAKDLASVTRISDVLVKANTLATASVEQFAEALSNKSAASMRALNIELEEGVAVLAAFAKQEIKGAKGGEYFSRLLNRLGQASEQNAKAWEKYGFDMFDAGEQMRPVADIIQNLENVLGGLTPELKMARLSALGFTAESKEAVMPLLGMSDAIRTYEKSLKSAGGLTEQVASKQMKSFSNQMKIVKNQLTVMGIEIGQVLAPMVTKLTGYVQKGIKAWQGLSPEMKKVIVYVGLAAAAVSPLLVALSVIPTVLGAMAGGLAVVGPALAAVGVATAAIGAAAASMGISWDDATSAVKRFTGNATGFVKNFSTNMGILWRWVGDNWQSVLGDMARAMVVWAGNAVHNAMVMVKGMTRSFAVLQGWLYDKFQQIFSGDFNDAVIAGITTAVEKIRKFAEFVVETLKSAFTGGIGAPDMATFIRGMQNDFEQGAKGAGLGESLKKVWSEELGRLKSPLEGFESSIAAMPEFELGPEMNHWIATTGKQIGKGLGDNAMPEVSKALGTATGARADWSGTQVTKVGSAERVARQVQSAYGQGGKDRQQQVVGLLERIAEAAEGQEEKEGIVLEAANFKG